MNRRAHPGAGRPRAGRLAAVRRLLRADRGASAVELAILAPALLLLTMVTIQFALVFQARQAALAAAQEGARDARVLAVSEGGAKCAIDVRQDTMRFYNGLGTKILTKVTVNPVTTPSGMAGVTISGSLNSLVSVAISVTVEGPEESFHALHPAGSQGSCGP